MQLHRGLHHRGVAVVTAPISGRPLSGLVGIPVPASRCAWSTATATRCSSMATRASCWCGARTCSPAIERRRGHRDRVITSGRGWLHWRRRRGRTTTATPSLVDRAKDLKRVGLQRVPRRGRRGAAAAPWRSRASGGRRPAPHTGESVKAYVKAHTASPSRRTTSSTFRHACPPGQRVPNKVWFVEDIPAVFGGKVIRRLLPAEGRQRDRRSGPPGPEIPSVGPIGPVR